MKKTAFILLLTLVYILPVYSQNYSFTKADSLRGTLSALRSCYDVFYYDLKIKVDPELRKISGSNDIWFKADSSFVKMQIDLFENMLIDAITFKGKPVKYRREFNAIMLELPEMAEKGEIGMLHVEYSGNPQVAARPPWDGGFVWKKDKNGKDWVGVACEGTGASLWWPNKDHLSDEPDSMSISIIHPLGLKAVANGVRRKVKDLDVNWTQTDWFVSYPINNYNVTVNIGDYVHWHDTFVNVSGTHDLDYYVLSYNEEVARKQFEQVKPMMRVYEKHFGEYPFWRDGYALVETYYLGMEHQGAIAYGNHYRKGYDGFDALGLGFDYIIIHETGHEWWGNSVSCKDHAELWIHESFCTYSESVYVEELWDRETADKYLMSQRRNIGNMTPIVGPLDVNFDGWVGSDMYYKGAWMLHTLRNEVNNDSLWWATLKNFAESFKYKNTDTREVVKWWSDHLGNDYSWLMNEYLYEKKPPVFEYTIKKKGSSKTQIKCRWVASNPDFKLSLRVGNKDNPIRIHPVTEWKKFIVDVPVNDFTINTEDWYGNLKNLKKK